MPGASLRRRSRCWRRSSRCAYSTISRIFPAHPQRPLPSGRATPAEFGAAAGVFAAAALALAYLSAGVVGAAALAVVLAYGIALWPLGRAIPHLERRPLLEMALTYPVQVLATVFLLASTYQRLEPGAATPQIIWVFVFFAGAFLHFEFARKTAARPRPGEAYYSNALGSGGAAAVALGAIGALTARWPSPRG